MPGGDTREASIDLPIDGASFLERFDVIERLSEPFVIHAQVVCDDMVDFFPHLGKSITITVKDETGSPIRYFNGVLFEADYIDVSGTGCRYQLTLRPWFYYLTRNLDYRIYQDKNATDIIKELFDLRGCADVDFSKLSGTPPVREYCVQYRESDYTFVSRLMEEEGFYYFFQHDDNVHKMVLCNARSSHPDSDYSSVPFIAPSGGAQTFDDRMWLWNERVMDTGELKSTMRNWDFKRPTLQLEGANTTATATPADKTEVYDFPGVFMEIDDGAKRAETLVKSVQRERRLYVGEGDARALACGVVFKLARHTYSRLNQDYIVVGLRYSLETQAYRSGGGGGGDGSSSVSVEAVPASEPWRAPIRTPKPVARGPETAIVTGPSGEVIYTDKYGRVKVQFHWDRVGQHDDKTTCFIRVSHHSADANFGHLVLPRIGQEVIVDFLNGDPDRPIITGRVYNDTHMQAETLPAEKTRSTWRSQTIGDVGKDYDNAETAFQAKWAFNLIGMEDKGGSELLRFWASRDCWTTVWRDDKTLVNRDQTLRVGHDRTTNIKNNETKTVEDGDETHTVQSGKRTTSIKMDDSLTVTDGNLSVLVKKGDMSTEVSTGNQSTKISQGNQSNEVSMGNQTNKVSMGNKSTEVSMGNMDTQVKMGNYTLKTSLGGVTIEAMQSIELKVMGNSIKIDPTGVTINGIMVKIEGQAMLQATSPMTQINGDAMTTVKGAIVMIN